MTWSIEDHIIAPELPSVLASLFSEKPILDLGCGTNYYLWCLKRIYGREGMGVDGTDLEQWEYLPVLVHDLNEPLDLNFRGNVLSVEVGEHIENEAVFIENVTRHCDDTLVLSWAVPGQGGKGHVNEQTNDYVIGKVRMRGFVFDVEATCFARSVQYLRTPWLNHTLMVFRKGKG